MLKKFRVSYNTSKVKTYLVKMFNVKHAIEAEAAVKNTTLYDGERDLEHIVRGFKVHKNCFQDFTQ